MYILGIEPGQWRGPRDGRHQPVRAVRQGAGRAGEERALAAILQVSSLQQQGGGSDVLLKSSDRDPVFLDGLIKFRVISTQNPGVVKLKTEIKFVKYFIAK